MSHLKPRSTKLLELNSKIMDLNIKQATPKIRLPRNPEAIIALPTRNPMTDMDNLSQLVVDSRMAMAQILTHHQQLSPSSTLS